MPTVGNNPTLIPQGGNIQIIAGDSYQSAESREYEWVEESAVMPWPTLTSATITFKAQNARSAAPNIEVAGEVKTPTGTKKVAVELTSANTEPLLSGGYTYAVVARLENGHKVTLSRGRVTVEGQTSS